MLIFEDVSKFFYFFSSPWRQFFWALGLGKPEGEFTALKDVSFELRRGESLGVIGTNGSGKSTLLKLAAEILLPSRGRVKIQGTVASLIELGVGFHGELTGRENVLLNGFFAGLSPGELEKKVRFVEEFSELGKFFDRPVRTYSTGMYMRLAFSLAIAVEPEILVVDEALSVGDQAFQKKCVDYIQELRRRGVSLLFCSHDMYLVEFLCERALWLRDGEVARIGRTREVVAAYQQYLLAKKEEEVFRCEESPIILTSIEAWGPEGRPRKDFSPFESLSLRLRYRSLVSRPLKVHFGLGIYREDRIEAFACASHLQGLPPLEVPPYGEGEVELFLPQIRLLDGSYIVTVVIFDENGVHIYYRRQEKECFRVLLPEFVARGAVYLDYEWRFEKTASSAETFTHLAAGGHSRGH